MTNSYKTKIGDHIRIIADTACHRANINHIYKVISLTDENEPRILVQLRYTTTTMFVPHKDYILTNLPNLSPSEHTIKKILHHALHST